MSEVSRLLPAIHLEEAPAFEVTRKLVARGRLCLISHSPALSAYDAAGQAASSKAGSDAPWMRPSASASCGHAFD